MAIFWVYVNLPEGARCEFEIKLFLVSLCVWQVTCKNRCTHVHTFLQDTSKDQSRSSCWRTIVISHFHKCTATRSIMQPLCDAAPVWPWCKFCWVGILAFWSLTFTTVLKAVLMRNRNCYCYNDEASKTGRCLSKLQNALRKCCPNTLNGNLVQ